MSLLFGSIIAGSVKGSRIRQCSACGRRQLVPQRRRSQVVTCKRCGRRILPPRAAAGAGRSGGGRSTMSELPMPAKINLTSPRGIIPIPIASRFVPAPTPRAHAALPTSAPTAGAGPADESVGVGRCAKRVLRGDPLTAKRTDLLPQEEHSGLLSACHRRDPRHGHVAGRLLGGAIRPVGARTPPPWPSRRVPVVLRRRGSRDPRRSARPRVRP